MLVAVRAGLYVPCMARLVPFTKKPSRVAVVRLSGLIATGGRPGASLNDESYAAVLERAFRRGRPKAVALVVNSPGGSPVQSSLLGARIRRLSEEKKIPVYAFVEDVAASGGYWIASAADEIWIDQGSIVGSIGVISASFGAHDLIDRYGIERRVYTAGRSKSMLDPFRPENPDDVARLKEILEQLHSVFIEHVTARRGAKLDKNADLFTGEIWLGARAVEVGLADGLGHLVPKMKERFGEDVRFLRYGIRRGLLSRLGARAFAEAASTLEERVAFARFGL